METWNGTKEKPSKWNQRASELYICLAPIELEPKNFIIIWRGVHVVLTHANYGLGWYLTYSRCLETLLTCSLRAKCCSQFSHPCFLAIAVYAALGTDHGCWQSQHCWEAQSSFHHIIASCTTLRKVPANSLGNRCGTCGVFVWMFFGTGIEANVFIKMWPRSKLHPWLVFLWSGDRSALERLGRSPSWLKKPHSLPVLSWCVLILYVLGWWVKHLSPTYLQRQDYGCSCLWKSNSVRAAVQQKWALSNRIRSVDDMASYHHQQLS